MIKGLEGILIGSPKASKLAKFYREVVGLIPGEVMEIGDKGEEGYEFKLGKGPGLYIIDHSGVKGKSREPERVMFNLEVDDLEKEVKRLKKAGARVVADMYHVQDYGYIATFADTDGNYFQLVKTRA
ncbi:hypothetical protein A3D85_01755 [Candidatus Amesbacteria bacterium RIFCSPHIGHO2_02_FULL_47_9]|nr:MAG: hypothetical protein A3D85_01755 [Candidatus Amesbacteria bacterium RIFCSPHIGHO2_02_FULL_47_9]